MRSSAPDTIVLIHGFWVTPRSWEAWIPHFEQRGYRVLAPAYPGFEVEVESLNEDPSPIVSVTVPQIIDKLSALVRSLDKPPILMGHSAGGVWTQMLLDRGLGACGVTFNSAGPQGVRVVPPSQLKASFPVLKNPANRHRAVGLTLDEWRYTFTNTFPEEEVRRTYQRYAIPASGRIFWDSVLANFKPGHGATWVNYRNLNRAPLLFISGSKDHLMPPAIQKSNVRHYAAGLITDHVIVDGFAHLLPAQRGWERVADLALHWAEQHVGPQEELAPWQHAPETEGPTAHA